MQAEQRDDDMGDRKEQEGRTASLALLGGLFIVLYLVVKGVIGSEVHV